MLVEPSDPVKTKAIDKATTSVSMPVYFQVAGSARHIAENSRAKKGDKFLSALQYVNGKYLIALKAKVTVTEPDATLAKRVHRFSGPI